jgi:hypothetical protein
MASHLVQPNDKFFHIVKNATSEIAHNLGFLDPDFCVTKERFAKVYYYGEKKSLTEKNVRSAWAKSGSWPIGIERLPKEYIIEDEDMGIDMTSPQLDPVITTESPLCEACGNFPPEPNPLVTAGLIDPCLVNILKAVKKKTKKKRTAASARVITGAQFRYEIVCL